MSATLSEARGFLGLGMYRFAAETLRAFVPDVDHPYESALVFPRVFTPRQCARITALGTGLAADEALVGGTSAEFAREAATRKARAAWIDPGDDTLWIFDKLTKVAQKANRVYGFDLIGFTEPLQFTMYDRPGAFYDWHQDGLGGELAVRKLSMVVQLSDPADYVGGDLEIFQIVHEQDEDFLETFGEDARAQGSVTVFPAFEYHRVRRMRSGKRFSLVAWLGGPPFR